DVFLMVRRQKTSILLDAKENTTVHELKKMIAAITKVLPENQQLYKDDEVMENNKILGDYRLNCSTAKPQDPAQVGLAYRESETSGFESLEITPFSIPPELPDVMKGLLETHEQAMA
ncbi:Elongin-B, partial [Araneus ventricosus]